MNPLWLVAVAVITWLLGDGYYPSQVDGISAPAAYGLGFLSVLLLFASILAHEFGHALVARRRGIEVEEIDLWLLGGVAKMSGHPSTPGDELRFALAGPAVTLLIAGAFGALALALPASTPAALRAVVGYQAGANLMILGFNLIPAFPLDGGRVTRSLLWRRSGDLVAVTDTAAGLGRAFGYLLIVVGVLLTLGGKPGGLWLVLIGVFIVVAANAERLQEQARALLAGKSAGRVMSRPAITIPAELTLAEAQPYFIRYRHPAFPVTDQAGRALGLIGIGALERTPRGRWATTFVGDCAEMTPRLLVVQGDDIADLLEEPAFARLGRAAVVDEDDRPIGVISITDLERILRAERARARSGGSSRVVPH